MSKIIDVAAIHFNVSERGDQGRDEAFRQFREAEKRLDGTGVDLVVIAISLFATAARLPGL